MQWKVIYGTEATVTADSLTDANDQAVTDAKGRMVLSVVLVPDADPALESALVKLEDWGLTGGEARAIGLRIPDRSTTDE